MVSPGSSSAGAIPGPIPAGRWRAQVDIERTAEDAEYEIVAVAEFGTPEELLDLSYPADYVSKSVEGWYKGELHAHSWESDGRVPIEEQIRAARMVGLDFFALTDHFTTSGWRFLPKLMGSDIALMRGLEITAHAGHANLHGLSRWVDVFVDGRDDWDINQAARAAHTQGGLFCINHAFSNDLSWRYHEFDWNLADLMEIYHNLEGQNNSLQPALWDHHLNLGQRIVGVGGIDSHHPFDGRHRLGMVVTYVYAPNLSERGIIQGLKSGRVYASLGPELEFTAQPIARPNEVIHMGGEAPVGEPLRFRVELRKLQYPSRLFILKNGLYHDMLELPDPAANPVIEFEETAKQPCYFRVEVYAVPPYEENTLRARDWRTVRVLSNPIFVGRMGQAVR